MIQLLKSVSGVPTRIPAKMCAERYTLSVTTWLRDFPIRWFVVKRSWLVGDVLSHHRQLSNMAVVVSQTWFFSAVVHALRFFEIKKKQKKIWLQFFGLLSARFFELLIKHSLQEAVPCVGNLHRHKLRWS